MSLRGFSCCNKKLKKGEVWFLKDIKDFTARKLYVSKCPYCNDDVLLLIEKRTSDNKIFINQIKGIEAVKTLYREKKRKLQTIPDVESVFLYGWVYGVNVEIKNKKGDITQLRQYSADFSGNKSLTRKYYAR